MAAPVVLRSTFTQLDHFSYIDSYIPVPQLCITSYVLALYAFETKQNKKNVRCHSPVIAILFLPCDFQACLQAGG